MNYSIYVLDTETTGLDPYTQDVIEVSFQELKTGRQKTWSIKPLNPNTIDAGALRVNGHVLDDLLHKTAKGKQTYLDPSKVIIEIENWLAEDDFSTDKRIMCGQNIAFDKYMLENLWKKCNSSDSFPFGRRTLDTMQIEFFLDMCKESFADSYSLNALTKKYNVKNDKAHTAEADVKATAEVFKKQVETFKKYIK